MDSCLDLTKKFTGCWMERYGTLPFEAAGQDL